VGDVYWPGDLVEVVQEACDVIEGAIYEVKVVNFRTTENQGETRVPVCLLPCACVPKSSVFVLVYSKVCRGWEQVSRPKAGSENNLKA